MIRRPSFASSANRRLLALRRRPDQEQGSILVVVVGSMLILGMFATVGFAYSMSSQRFARHDQDYLAAMAAAQSGVEDFISRLNGADTYAYSPDCTNLAWEGPMDPAANTCGWTTTTAPGWLPVSPGVTDPTAPHYHYSVDSSQRNQGTYRLLVTGRVNGVYRSIDTTVGKGGSTDYVYYTDFESADPKNVQAYPPSGTGKVECGKNGSEFARYWHSSPSRSGQGCVEITFVGGDRLDGEVFTNDSIYASLKGGVKPVFLEQVYTSDRKCLSATAASSTWEPNCLRSGGVADFSGKQPKYHDPFYLPDNSAAFADLPGCHYYGSTRILFNQNGTMTVWNKKTVNKSVAPLAVAAAGGTKPACGTLTQLDSASGATVAVPTEQTIYVAASTATPRQCYAGELGGPSGATLPVGTFSSTAASGPTSASSTYDADVTMLETTKYCAEGNLYVEGVVKGRVTLAAAQSIVAIGDVVLAGGRAMTSPDMVGMVATNSVEVFHPRKGVMRSQGECTKYNGDGTCKTRSTTKFQWVGTLDSTTLGEVSNWPRRFKEPGAGSYTPTKGIMVTAAVQTLLHSFYVQQYAVGGEKGDLTVYGSLAQRWRGIVGQGENGYSKDYRYDRRLQFATPPYFPKWANARYTLRYSGEVSTPPAARP